MSIKWPKTVYCKTVRLFAWGGDFGKTFKERRKRVLTPGRSQKWKSETTQETTQTCSWEMNALKSEKRLLLRDECVEKWEESVLERWMFWNERRVAGKVNACSHSTCLYWLCVHALDCTCKIVLGTGSGILTALKCQVVCRKLWNSLWDPWRQVVNHVTLASWDFSFPSSARWCVGNWRMALQLVETLEYNENVLKTEREADLVVGTFDPS